jgi:hypothetical protein
LHALDSLAARPLVSAAVASYATTALLATPIRDAAACEAECARRCNPHARGSVCAKACAEGCAHEGEMGASLARLVRGLGGAGHDLGALLASSVPNAHPTRLEAAAAVASGALPAWPTAAAAGPLPLGNLSAAQLTSLILRHGPIRTALPWEAQPTWPAAGPRGRSLRINWKEVNFDSFSLTFVDLVLSHKPLDWSLQFGDPELLGSIGGAGAGAMVRVANHAWLRVGLFGGGFGISLDNRAEAGAYLVSLKAELFKAILEFNLALTYRIDPGDGLLDLAQDLVGFANTAITKFESLKSRT